MSARIGVALIGAGRIGQRHARTLATQIPGSHLIGIADASPDAARRTAVAVRLDRWTTDADALINDPAVQAVVIASSTGTHAKYIISAAQAGKDVFCEKPIALDLERTDEALAAVDRAGVRLQIGFQRRFDKGYHRAKELIAAGKLGRIETIRDTMRDPAPAPREYIAQCGGLYRDMTIHNFDCVRWLMGAEVEEVFAFGAVLVDPMFAEFDDIDTSVVTLRFNNGGIGVIDNSRRSGYGYDVRTEIFGGEGALFVGFSRDTPLLHLNKQGVHSDHIHWFLERFDQAFVAELVEFIDAIANDRQTAVTGTDGRAALELAYACETSRRENRPVSLKDYRRVDSG